MYNRNQDQGQEFVTQGGLWGWIDRNSRGFPVLELSLHSRVRLARENVLRITNDWKEYMEKIK